MRYINYLFLLIFLNCILAGCKFTQLSNSKNLSALRNIELLQINDVHGTEFYQYMKTYLGDHDAKFQLKIDINFGNYDSFLGRSTDIIENIEYIKVNFVLFDKISNNVLITENFTKKLSYNARNLPYQTMVIIEKVRNDLSINAADEVLNRLMFFCFKNQK